MRLWVWRHVRIELPDDWEMLQFSRQSQGGRCAFADRYQFRLELNWREVPGPPDMERMTSDYLAKLRLDGSMPDAAVASSGGWQGIEGHQNGLFTSRFGRHFATERCLVEAVLLWPDKRDADLERAVLASVAPEPEHLGRFQRWRAFGMDILASSGLALTDCRVEPANACLTFADERSGRQETFQRLGMVPEWLDGSARQWLEQQMPRDVALVSQDATEDCGHAIERLVGTRRATLVRKRSRYEASAWICPADGRLYCAANTKATETEPRRLACCPDLELPL